MNHPRMPMPVRTSNLFPLPTPLYAEMLTVFFLVPARGHS